MIQLRHRTYVLLELTTLVQTKASRKKYHDHLRFKFVLFLQRLLSAALPSRPGAVRMPDARRAELKRPSEEQCILERRCRWREGTAASGAASSVKAVVAACSPRVVRRRGDGSPTTIFMDNWRALGEISTFGKMSSIPESFRERSSTQPRRAIFPAARSSALCGEHE